MDRRNSLTILGKSWNSPIFLERTVRGVAYRCRLKNWKELDCGRSDRDNFSWGYFGEGPACTSYSILRELFDKVTAEDYEFAFMANFVSKVPQDSVLKISGEEVCLLLGLKPKLKR